MNAMSNAIVHTCITISFLGITLTQVAPAEANTYRSAQGIGSADFGDCQSTTVVGGSSVSLEKYQIRQAAQFDVAIADYSNTLTADIAQLPITRTRTAWKLKNGELELYSLALESPSDLVSANSRVAVLVGEKEDFKDF